MGRGRGGGRGGGNRAPDDRDTLISKKLSWVLRHGAQKERIALDEGGFASCRDILAWQPLRSLKLTFPELEHIVATNAKKRYELAPIEPPPPSSTDDDPASQYKIRASQGHSLKIASEALLSPLDPDAADCPALVVHGTYPAAWKRILESGGLSRMGRGHVHFALGVGGASAVGKGKAAAADATGPEAVLPEPAAGAATEAAASTTVAETEAGDQAEAAGEPVVISGMRAGAKILVWVDVKRSAREGGLKWWKSANGVVLTEGDEKGFVKLEWVDRVEERTGAGTKGEAAAARKVIWPEEKKDEAEG